MADAVSLASSESARDDRFCGSPAKDAYAHAASTEGVRCLEESPTATLYKEAMLKAAVDGEGPEATDVAVLLFSENVSIDGLAVAWGPTNKQESIIECARACVRHVPSGHGVFGNLPCNAFVFCPELECFEPDAHDHTQGDCWLKVRPLPTERPWRVPMRFAIDSH